MAIHFSKIPKEISKGSLYEWSMLRHYKKKSVPLLLPLSATKAELCNTKRSRFACTEQAFLCIFTPNCGFLQTRTQTTALLIFFCNARMLFQRKTKQIKTSRTTSFCNCFTHPKNIHVLLLHIYVATQWIRSGKPSCWRTVPPCLVSSCLYTLLRHFTSDVIVTAVSNI